MTGYLIDSLTTTDALAEAFSDASVLDAMVAFEVALTRASGSVGMIPARAAKVIEEALAPEVLANRPIDAREIAEGGRTSATPAIAMVNALKDRVRTIDRDSAGYVHWTATSQDVTDTALVLLLRRAVGIIAKDQDRIRESLKNLSDAHAGTLMLGRTLLQPAAPMTFGLKAAGWYRAVTRSWHRLIDACEHGLVLQYGGATGTRAAASGRGAAVAVAMASELGLRVAVPWHTDRDGFGSIATASGLYTAALAKIARDISLLMQAEVSEVAESGGGSSSMPHKRNPAGCTVALAAATRVPGLVAAFLSGMTHEHERSAGGGQAEWSTLAALVQATGAAAAAMARVLEGLTVDVRRMRDNLDATGGTIYADRAVTLLTGKIGADTAHTIVAKVLQHSRESGRRFSEVLLSQSEVAAALSPEELAGLVRPESAVGDAEALRVQLLSERD
jgi:3-carboxy-cis,cis-muconate cycloisomerase